MTRKFAAKIRRDTYVVFLWLLTILFVLRVLGQLVQQVAPVSWLPEFTRWHGSATPYWLLLAIQLVIIVIMARATLNYGSGKVVAGRKKGKWLLALGTVYFASMAIRLTIGLVDPASSSWFQKTIPAFFHLVLASFVLLIGAYHMNWVAGDDMSERDYRESL
jgi:hypothetical protein